MLGQGHRSRVRAKARTGDRSRVKAKVRARV